MNNKPTKAEVALVREKNARQRAVWERQRDMPQYMALIIMEVRSESRGDAWHLTKTLHCYVAQAAMAAGDLLWVADEQNPGFFGDEVAAESDSGYVFFEASVHFVSEHLNWEQASEWLREALDGYRDENVTVLSVEQSRAIFGS